MILLLSYKYAPIVWRKHLTTSKRLSTQAVFRTTVKLFWFCYSDFFRLHVVQKKVDIILESLRRVRIHSSVKCSRRFASFL